MSWEAMAWAKQQKGLGAQGKLLLILLAEKTGSTHSCYPSVARLADEMEVSERTVQRLLAKFDEAKLIRRTPRKRRTTVYTLLLTSIVTTAADNVVMEDPQVEIGDNRSPIGDSMGDTQTVTTRVTPRLSPEPQKNTNTSGGAELALADTDGTLFLVRAEEVNIDARVVVAAWVDEVRKNGTEPSKAQVGRVAKTAKELLEKNQATRVLDAARHAGEHGHGSIDSALTILNGKPFESRRPEKKSSIVTSPTGTVFERG
jgi:DNA-binding MarR family transcriptional regulator